MKNVVVGVDGRPASRAALRWAAEEIGHQGALHALAASAPVHAEIVDRARAEGHDPRAALGEVLRREWVAPFVGSVGQLTSSVSVDDAAVALASAAERREADAVVVGADVSTLGATRGAGTTVRGLLAHLACPLVVVPSTVRRSDARPVAVGAGDGASTDAAMRWATRHADETGRALELVRIAGDGPLFRIDGMLDVRNVFLERVGSGRGDLGDWEWVARDAGDPSPLGAPVPERAEGVPPAGFDETTETAALLVLGRHGSGPFGDHHVAPSLRYALTHLHCPVVVVPLAPSVAVAD